MIHRTDYIKHIQALLSRHPVVALIGARQVGKTTLAREIAKPYEITTFFDLEDPRSLARLNGPLLTLSSLTGLIIIDEAQHKPDLFNILRILAIEDLQLSHVYIIHAGTDSYSLTETVTAMSLQSVIKKTFIK